MSGWRILRRALRISEADPDPTAGSAPDGIVRFRRRYVPAQGPQYNVGEAAAFPRELADRLIRERIARRATPSTPRPTPMPPPLVSVRLTTSRHTVEGRSYSRGEVVGEDRETAGELVNQGLAVTVDAPLPAEPMIPPVPRRYDLPTEVITAIEHDGIWMPDRSDARW